MDSVQTSEMSRSRVKKKKREKKKETLTGHLSLYINCKGNRELSLLTDILFKISFKTNQFIQETNV